jgi:hypothetical protein
MFSFVFSASYICVKQQDTGCVSAHIACRDAMHVVHQRSRLLHWTSSANCAAAAAVVVVDVVFASVSAASPFNRRHWSASLLAMQSVTSHRTDSMNESFEARQKSTSYVELSLPQIFT